MDSKLAPIWINVLEREGWIVITVEGRKVGIVLSTTEGGVEHLKVAGYHLGSRYVGERYNILSARVEPIPNYLHHSMNVLVRNALPVELRGLPISFL